MPLSMFLVFVATVLAGSIGALHYVVVHVILGRPFGDEDAAAARAAARARKAAEPRGVEGGPARATEEEGGARG